MFAALTVPRLREAVQEAGLEKTAHWVSPDEVEAVDLPLAKAVEKVLASMQSILRKTAEACQEEMKAIEDQEDHAGPSTGEDGLKKAGFRKHLKKTKAAEVRVVRNVKDLIDPPDLGQFVAKEVETK